MECSHWSSGLYSPGAGVFLTTAVAGTIAIIQPFDAMQQLLLLSIHHLPETAFFKISFKGAQWRSGRASD